MLLYFALAVCIFYCCHRRLKNTGPFYLTISKKLGWKKFLVVHFLVQCLVVVLTQQAIMSNKPEPYFGFDKKKQYWVC